MTGDATATDASGCVTVVVDDSGRLDRLEVSARWREKLDRASLGSALQEALGNALLERIEQDQARTEPTGPEPRALFADAFGELEPGQIENASLRVAEVNRAVLTAVFDELDRTLAAIGTSYTGSDDRRYVEVTMDVSGTVTALTLDERWLESASRERVVASTQAAFRAAYDLIDTATAPVGLTRPEVVRRFSDLLSPVDLRHWLQKESEG